MPVVCLVREMRHPPHQPSRKPRIPPANQVPPKLRQDSLVETRRGAELRQLWSRLETRPTEPAKDGDNAVTIVMANLGKTGWQLKAFSVLVWVSFLAAQSSWCFSGLGFYFFSLRFAVRFGFSKCILFRFFLFMFSPFLSHLHFFMIASSR
jgi:hypothetical protein